MAKYVVSVVSEWPVPSRTLPPRLSLPKQPRVHNDKHCFQWVDPFWRCLLCSRRTNSHPHDLTVRCGRSAIERVIEAKNGHTLWAANTDSNEVLIFCSICWAYAVSSPAKLAKPCAGPPRHVVSLGRKVKPFGFTSKSRILKRLHPANNKCRLSRPRKL